MNEEFISKLQYLLGEYGYKYLCSTNQRYTNPDFQKALEISLLLDYFVGQDNIPNELVQSTQYKSYLNTNVERAETAAENALLYAQAAQTALNSFESSKWTSVSDYIYRNSKVLIGTTNFTDVNATLEVSGRISQVGLGTSTYFGYETGLNGSTSDRRSTGFGYQALKTQITGFANTAFGHKSLTANTTGQFNDAFGADSLLRNTTGEGNSAFGTATLQANTTGIYNAGFGLSAMYNMATGSYNTAIGTQALWSATTASYNTAIGMDSLESNIAGNYNVALGYSTAQGQSSISNSIIIGALSRPSGNSQTNQIVIGYNQVGLGSNTTVIGNASITLSLLYGELRVNTINNLSASATNILTYDANKTLKNRTMAEFSIDQASSISGWNPAVRQRLEHTATGVLEWVNV